MNEIAVQSTIDMLCQKFNVTAEYLIPRIQQYKLATTMFGAIVSAVLSVLILIGMIILYKRVDSYDHDGVIIALILLELLSVILIIINLYDHIGWKYAPEIKTIEWVTQLIRE